MVVIFDRKLMRRGYILLTVLHLGSEIGLGRKTIREYTDYLIILRERDKQYLGRARMEAESDTDEEAYDME